MRSVIEPLKRVYPNQYVMVPCHHRKMLTGEGARPLVLSEIDDVRGHVTYDLEILRVGALPFEWIFYWGQSETVGADSTLGWEATVPSWWIVKTSG
ncbi:hypothetical protein ACWEFL_24855 [Streptomyces sp. NPDC004838]